MQTLHLNNVYQLLHVLIKLNYEYEFKIYRNGNLRLTCSKFKFYRTTLSVPGK